MAYASVTGYFCQGNILLGGNIKDSDGVIMGPADFLPSNVKWKNKTLHKIHNDTIICFSAEVNWWESKE